MSEWIYVCASVIYFFFFFLVQVTMIDSKQSLKRVSKSKRSYLHCRDTFVYYGDTLYATLLYSTLLFSTLH